jgi:hypothetical protein
VLNLKRHRKINSHQVLDGCPTICWAILGIHTYNSAHETAGRSQLHLVSPCARYGCPLLIGRQRRSELRFVRSWHATLCCAWRSLDLSFSALDRLTVTCRKPRSVTCVRAKIYALRGHLRAADMRRLCEHADHRACFWTIVQSTERPRLVMQGQQFKMSRNATIVVACRGRPKQCSGQATHECKR